jgi:hypothetical protein
MEDAYFSHIAQVEANRHVLRKITSFMYRVPANLSMVPGSCELHVADYSRTLLCSCDMRYRITVAISWDLMVG